MHTHAHAFVRAHGAYTHTSHTRTLTSVRGCLRLDGVYGAQVEAADEIELPTHTKVASPMCIDVCGDMCEHLYMDMCMDTSVQKVMTSRVVGLEAGGLFSFRVRAVTRVGEGGWSARSDLVQAEERLPKVPVGQTYPVCGHVCGPVYRYVERHAC